MFGTSFAVLALVASAAEPLGAGQTASTDSYVRIFISPAGEPFRSSSGEYPSRAWFDLADTNHDGKLTAAEMSSQAESFFRSLDLDKSGRIDGSEIRNYEDKIAPETRTLTTPVQENAVQVDDYNNTLGYIGGASAPPMQSSSPSRKPKDLPRGAGRFSFFNFAEPVMRADTDLSGSVSLDEFNALQSLQFGTLDTKHRGYLEFGDLPTTPAQNMRIKVKAGS